MLMGVLEGYFLPEYAFNTSPKSGEHRLANCRLMFDLIEDAGLQRPNCRPEDLASGDLKSILRILYLLFSNYKDRD